MSEEVKQNIVEQESVAVDNTPQIPALPQKGNFPAMFDMVAMLLIVVVVQTVVSFVCVLLGVPMPEMLGGEIGDVEQYIGQQVVRGQGYAIIYPISMIIAYLFILLYTRLRDGKGRIARVSTRGFNPNIILAGLIWIVAAQIVVEPLMALFPTIDQDAGQGFWAIVTSVIFAPVFEELIFRGAILEALLRRYGRLVSVIVSSLLFAVVHFQPEVMVAAFVTGFILGTVYLHTSSIFSTIILHSINNAIAYSLITLDLDNYSYSKIFGGDSFYYIIYAVAFVICVIATVDTWRRRKPKGVISAK